MISCEYNAFTTTYDSISDKLSNTAEVSCAGKTCAVQALWDTGATCTCISYEVARLLKLIPTGFNSILTPSGRKVVHTYLIDILLPNGVMVGDVVVCDSDIGEQGLGLLIGMNIINIGELCVSSKGGRTTFSFIIPPVSDADYIPEANKLNN
ncbi:MAG: hypothetical protein IKI75_08370 [Lachnospiraceae bacterium]|nr:hypothetical protein [Lachnospiraceae bacterium]